MGSIVFNIWKSIGAYSREFINYKIIFYTSYGAVSLCLCYRNIVLSAFKNLTFKTIHLISEKIRDERNTAFNFRPRFYY